MKTTDRQLESILERAETIRVKKRRQRLLIGEGAAASLCLILLLAIGALMPQPEAGHGSAMYSQYGSLIITSPRAGLVVIGVFAIF